MAQLIDGKVISAQIKDEVKEKVAGLKEQGCEVTLAVIQVGADPASSVYVRNKKKACEYVGIRSLAYELPEETTEEKLLELIRELNDRTDVNGILVQLPLPKHIDSVEDYWDVAHIMMNGSFAATKYNTPTEEGDQSLEDLFFSITEGRGAHQ